MANGIDRAAAKARYKQFQSLQIALEKAVKAVTTQQDQIIQAAKALAVEQATDVLKNTPIEEINRDKKGFRVKTLRDHGIETVADLVNISLSRLTSINGISPQAASEMKQAAQEIAQTASQSVKIRLSEDNKTAAAGKLVTAIAKYRKTETPGKACLQLSDAHRNNVTAALAALKPATGGLRWMFASSAKKQRAAEALAQLQELANSTYPDDVKTNTEAVRRTTVTTERDAWKDFSENSIAFFNILEEFCPEAVGTEKAVYGLPEELAKSIAQQEVAFEGLNCELRRYQEWGVKYILHQGKVLLGDEMGLGKTVQAIAAMVSLRNMHATHFVVVCPASVLTNWCREVQKMSDLSVVKIHGDDREEMWQTWINNGGVAVTTFETTAFLELDEAFGYSLLVVDEAHYIKNRNAKRTQNVKRLSENTGRILFMTGTALENKVEEMIALMDLLQPAVAATVHGMEFLSSAPQFRERVAPVYYRRRREDVLTELPELVETKEWCTMSKEEEAVYEEAVLAKKYTDARRVSWSVEDLTCSSKAQRLKEIVEEATEDGRKVIVFSFFLDTIEKVMSLLGEACVGPINGSVPPQKRQELVDTFNAAPAGTVLAAQIQAGGTGLNIQAASVVILCEPQFKPSIENQAISRAYRMGQTRNVLVYRLLCDETVDERVTELLESKQAIFDAFADESAVATESFELDESSFGGIMQKEEDRIRQKREA